MLNILILGGSEKISEHGFGFKTYEIRRFLQEAEHMPSVQASYLHLDQVEARNGVLTAAGIKIDIPDIVIPRALCPQTNKNCAEIIRAFEQAGALSVNSASSIFLAASKIEMGHALISSDVPYPRTTALDARCDDLESVGAQIGYPLIVKQAYGTHGIGVAKADNLRDFRNAVKEFCNEAPDNPLLAQECVLASHGRDVRAFVIGDRVVGSMLRQAASANEFRSNYTLGGALEAYDLPQEAQDIAVAAARALGLAYSGVDLLFAEAGYIVCEANKAPDFKGMEKTYPHLNIAREILEHAVSLAKRQEELRVLAKKFIEDTPVSLPVAPVFSGYDPIIAAPAS